MQLFDLVPQDFFRPLTGNHRREYMDILLCLWENCRRTPLHGASKTMMIDWAEDYFMGLQKEVVLEEEELEFSEGGGQTPRMMATAFLRRLKQTGWLEERPGSYEEEPKFVFHHKIVPIIRSFGDVISPNVTAYQGKLFKVCKLLQGIEQTEHPYEAVLREAVGDLEDLNTALRQLAASIGEYMYDLTKGKTPQEVLQLFDTYEREIVQGAYHRFKTSENLFCYKSDLLEQLQLCRGRYVQQLCQDCSTVERITQEEAAETIEQLISNLEENLKEIGNLMNDIDRQHIMYRTRAVQRAQFLLLSDATVKSKVNRLLQVISQEIQDTDELMEPVESWMANTICCFEQGYVDWQSLKAPVQPKQGRIIEQMEPLPELPIDVIVQGQEQLMHYIRSAVTAENVNHFAQKVLQKQEETSAHALAEQYGTSEELVLMIGLHTYSQSSDRVYEIEMQPRILVCGGLRFQDFTVRRRKHET